MKEFKTIEDKLDFEYYKQFVKDWLPSLRKRVFKARLLNEHDELIAIKENIENNIHLQKYKGIIIDELGLKNIKEGEMNNGFMDKKSR